ncbi:MAG: threonine synthase [Deltaproteobacteria bacterium CG12_big_fil_rev_8_21_14_0_65_43_10]|nr:MAG: threonine synthase [Deltaproteobacteria bacterium CG2_30_43_15]PIQ46146.1 MAG: threonine synthase [Deltaproteobacteria bacterium CG12_big_fil_rev_8_21_14_0_65_43_10]PIU85925.1 MAG: threonine synthase [Deltaproteobacteria bacterium CG06_land_8_20_14_3_00_44_19]PIX24784.1 MAG: threonine synthase [Deltaproteobacteria bacterium CG_4_8_14_3_um_filter_43_13]PIZ21143.1 MAG: threonine synthase [Deltaproteobacteria bacterium CG_4_10_14_0_8_um_filter_43_12]PJB41573.1 MAG: threonine synthase [Del
MQGIIKKYREFLPIKDDSKIITLNEGNTPLIRTSRLRDYINKGIDLYLKYEGLNPSGSFKDRGMTVAISKALEEGSKAVICASTGNTSASAAAYAAKGGLKAYVLIPKGKIALGKLSQAMMHGAVVIQLDGNFDEALKIVRDVSGKYPITMVNSLNPYRIEGQKTAAFEICDQLGFVPTFHALPVGNAGNITAYWKGFKEYKSSGRITSLPKMIGFQAEGAAPIVRGEIIKAPETVATAIRIGNPASWKQAEAARDESGGTIDMVSDEEIINAYQLIARYEGIFCEPASAASVAGVIKLNKQGLFKKGESIVCTLTGHGLKDPESAIKISGEPITLPPEVDKILEILEL